MSQDSSSHPTPPRRTPPPGSGLNPLVIVDATDKTDVRAHHPPRSDFGVWKALSSVFSVAMVIATLFTLWTPENLFANQMLDRMFNTVRPVSAPGDFPTPTASPRLRIGIVAGHWGNDPGAVCDDGLTEESVNLRIATLVKEILQKEGYEVDLLKEFDTRLAGYRALALISIHNDSCQYINAEATGFKVAAAASTIFPEKATRLTACMSQRYQGITGLRFHYNTVTGDMTEYHAFSEIHPDTTAAIIETGFLNLDKHILTNQTEMVARGVASGVLCFVRNEDIQRGPEQ